MGSGASTAAHKANPQRSESKCAAVSTNAAEALQTPAKHFAASSEAINAAATSETAADSEYDEAAELDALGDASATTRLIESTLPQECDLQHTADLQPCTTQGSEPVAEVLASSWKDLDKGFRKPSSNTNSVLPTVTKLDTNRARFDSLNIDTDDDATPREQCDPPQSMSLRSAMFTQPHHVSDRRNNGNVHDRYL